MAKKSMAMTITEKKTKQSKAGARIASLHSALPALQMPKLKTPAKTSGTQMPVLGKTTSKGVGIVQSVANGSGTQSSGRTTAPKVKTVKPAQQSATDRAANIHAFGAGDYSGGGELLEKAYKTARAAVKGIGSSYANIGGSAVEGMGNLQEIMEKGEYDKKIQQMKDNKAFYEQALKTGVNPRTGKRLTVDQRSRYYKILNTMYTDGKIAEMENVYKDATASQKARTMETANDAFTASDRLKASADKDVAAAKEGSGKVGQFLVDLGYTGTQLMADLAANAIAPGAGMVSMASRVYGDASAEARREGKTAGQQALSGLKGATIEVLTEKLFGGLAKAYGAGTADELVEKVADKLTKTEAGQRAAVWLINSGGEGLEEVVSDVLNPLADRALGLDDAAMELPTSISGQTADLKPYKQYNPFFQERRGDKTEYDIAKGFENYVYYLGNIFYHTDDIMRIRAAERYIRKTYSSEEANEMITQAEDARNFSDADIEEFLRMNGLVGKNTTLDEGDARILLNDYIDKLYDQIGNVTRYSEMAKYLDNYANRLAGKQNYVDRGAEAVTGRGSLNWINTLSGKYGGAKLAFNVSSAINQTSQLPMVAVENGEKYTAAAMRDFFKKDRSSFVNESNFLKGKKGVNWLLGAETGWEKFKQAGFSMTEAVDSFTAYTAVRSKYLKETAAGKSHAEAIKLADDYGRRVMGSRARSEKPVLFDTKNPFWQIATRFQLETLNSWEHVSRDLPNEFRKMAGEKGKTYAARVMGGRAAKYVLYAFLANLAVGELSGGSPVPFDLLGNTMEALGKAWGLTKSQTVATLLDSVLQAVFDERLLGTPEPEDDDDADWWAALESLFGNVANDVPVVSRAAALAGVGDQTLAVADLSKIADLAKSVKDKGLTSADTLDKAATAGGEFLYGGNQLRKTIQGTMDVLRGGRYNNGKLRYQVDQTPWNYFKGAVFGRSSLDEAQDYYAERSSDFSAKQTETFGNLQSAGVAAKESYDLIQEMRGIEKTDDESKAELQRKALMASNISGEGKAAAYYGLLATDKEKAAMDAIGDAEPTADMGEVTGLLVRFKSCNNDTEKLAALQDSGLTLSQKTSIYTNLIASEEALKEQSDLEAYDGITAEKYYQYKTAVTGLTGKAAKLAAINALDLLSEEKDALYFANGWAESKLNEAPWRSGRSAGVSMPVLGGSGVTMPVLGNQGSSGVQMPVLGGGTVKMPVLN